MMSGIHLLIPTFLNQENKMKLIEKKLIISLINPTPSDTDEKIDKLCTKAESIVDLYLNFMTAELKSAGFDLDID